MIFCSGKTVVKFRYNHVSWHRAQFNWTLRLYFLLQTKLLLLMKIDFLKSAWSWRAYSLQMEPTCVAIVRNEFSFGFVQKEKRFTADSVRFFSHCCLVTMHVHVQLYVGKEILHCYQAWDLHLQLCTSLLPFPGCRTPRILGLEVLPLPLRPTPPLHGEWVCLSVVMVTKAVATVAVHEFPHGFCPVTVPCSSGAVTASRTCPYACRLFTSFFSRSPWRPGSRPLLTWLSTL